MKDGTYLLPGFFAPDAAADAQKYEFKVSQSVRCTTGTVARSLADPKAKLLRGVGG